MEALEFKTILNGGTVTIPPEYSSRWEGKPVRVIVLEDSEYAPAPDVGEKKTMFTAISLRTKGFEFSRDEANER